MSLKEQLSKMFLNRSNSYRFYKEYYDARNVTDSNKELKKLKKEFKKFKKENEQFKRNTNVYIDSCNYLFNNIYLDYTHKPTKTLQNIKILCAELLVFVNKVCEKHDIQWWLDYGTLLGAVRHEGFVPWDDDVDIAMTRKNYNKFIKIIYEEVENNNLRDFIDIDYRRKDSNGDQSIHTRNDTGNHLVRTFMQLWIKRPINDINSILGGVDIFPYDYITAFHYSDIEKDFQNARTKYYKNLDNKMSYIDSLQILYKDLELSMNETDWLIPGVETSYGRPYESFKLQTFDRTKVFPLKKTKFEVYEFPIPNDSDYYLKKVYGKYHNIPKSVYRHNRIDNFRHVQNADELFEECIDRMREANDNFKF